MNGRAQLCQEDRMAPQFSLLQGEVKPNPEIDSQDIEKLLASFLNALLEEQRTANIAVLPEAESLVEPVSS